MNVKKWVLIPWVSLLVFIIVLSLTPRAWAQTDEPPDDAGQVMQAPPPGENEEIAQPPEPAEPPGPPEAPAPPGPPDPPPPPEPPAPPAPPAPPSPPIPPLPRPPWGQLELQYIKDLYVSSSPYQSGLLGLNIRVQRDPLLKYAIAEAEAFLDKYPESPLYPEAFILLGDCYLKNGEPQKAAATYVTALARFDLKPERATARIHLEEALRKGSKGDSHKISLLQSSFKPFPSSEQSYYVILQELGRADISGLTPWLVEQWKHFAVFYINSEKAPLALENAAQALLKLPDPPGAVMAYKKIIHFYPQSSSAAAAYFALGDIWRNDLKQPGKAIAAYLDAINQYPHDIRVEEAFWKITQVYQNDLKDYPKAVEAYQRLLDRFPEGTFAPQALWEMADLYVELGRPAEAVKAYLRLQKDFPKHPQAIQALWNAGTLTERDLKDPARATGFYERLIREYPGSKEAAEAKKRLEKLKSKT